jgi:hypothetical protein
MKKQINYLAYLMLLCCTLGLAQRMSAQVAYEAKVTKIFCNETTEGGEDEIYLEVTIDGGAATRYPGNSGYKSMNEDSNIATWYPPYSFTFRSSCTILIKELDDASGDDLIGSIQLLSSSPVGNKDLTGLGSAEGANYDVSYSLTKISTPVVAVAAPFKLVFNGLHCLETTDDGEDEVYLEVIVDGGTPITIPTYSMNERSQGAFEIDFLTPLAEMLTISDAAKKEYWLLPGSWNVQDNIIIRIKEDDPDPNPDDVIGEIRISKSDIDNNLIGNEFTSEGHYFATVSKETLKQRPAGIPAKFTLMDPDNGTRTDVVANQGSEGACVAFSTTSAIASKVINSMLAPGKLSEDDRAKVSNLSKSMFNASWFYSLRDVDPKTGKQGYGWWIYSALTKACNVTIPFQNGNKNYGIRLDNYYIINSDGSVSMVTALGLGSKPVVANPQVSRQDRMREYLLKKEVMLADFTVYQDFSAYVGSKKIYGGNIYQSGAGDKGDVTGHAVMVTGFTYPDVNDNDCAYWEVQNSWGPQWGDNGFCKFRTNSCDLDQEMYFPGNYYVCDLAGNRVSADEAKRLIREALVAAGPAGAAIGATMGGGSTGGGSNPPAVTPNTPANALSNKLVRIVNMARPDLRINIEKGPLSLDQIQDGAWSAQWKLVPVPGTSYFWIQNLWKPDQRLQVETGQLSTAPIHDGAWSAHWELKPTPTGTYVIKNRWRTGQSLFFDNGKLGFAALPDAAVTAWWFLFPVQ